MRGINIKCDKIKNQLIIKYLLSYFCQLNTRKGTAKAPTVDLSRLNTLKRTIRKVMEGGGKNKKIYHGREGDWKKNRATKKWRKNVPQSKLPCRANSLTNCIRMRGNLAVTVYCSCNFYVLVEFPLKGHCHATWQFTKNQKVSSDQLNFKTNDLVLLLKTIWMSWNCFLSPVATDGMDGNGLKLEKNWPIFSSFDATCSKNPQEICYG